MQNWDIMCGFAYLMRLVKMGRYVLANFLFWARTLMIYLLVSRPGGVKDCHSLNTTKTRDKRQLQGSPGS